ncbi:MAG: tRNA pseudouridine(55) synthase TruB [Ignavibacteria bacterium]|nr:tRNA pseudouridine(55) synthase TruB [Ignavibacteria bacterium]
MVLSKDNAKDFPIWLDKVKAEGGILLVDKPEKWTSFDVVKKIRNLIQAKKVGHTGTLDPFATGLLILLFNNFTKFQNQYQNLPKTYFATIKLGATTETYDVTAPEENPKDISSLNNETVINVIKSFVGIREQKPPIFSAKKYNGERLYKLARKKLFVEIQPTIIEIFKIEKINISFPYVSFIIECSKGTYIRSLAHDIGVELGVGAYLSSLRRLKIGGFIVEKALSIKDFEKCLNFVGKNYENL